MRESWLTSRPAGGVLPSEGLKGFPSKERFYLLVSASAS